MKKLQSIKEPLFNGFHEDRFNDLAKCIGGLPQHTEISTENGCRADTIDYDTDDGVHKVDGKGVDFNKLVIGGPGGGGYDTASVSLTLGSHELGYGI